MDGQNSIGTWILSPYELIVDFLVGCEITFWSGLYMQVFYYGLF